MASDEVVHERVSWHQKYRRIIWLSIIAVPLVLLLIAFGTEWGRVKLTRGAIASTEIFFPELEIEFGDIKSGQFGSWSFTELSIDYLQNKMVYAKNFTIEINPLHLLTAKIDIEKLTAEYLTINYNLINKYLLSRPKQAEASENSSQSTGFELPAIRLAELRIEHLQIIAKKLPGFPVVSVAGDGRYQWPEDAFYFQLEIREHLGDQLYFKLYAKETSGKNYSLDFKLNELAGGFISTQLQLPKAQNLAAEGKLALQVLKDNKLLVDIQEISLPFEDYQLSLTGTGTVGLAPWSLVTEGLRLAIDDRVQSLSGSLSGDFIDIKLQLDKLPLAISSPWQTYLQDGWLSADLAIKGALPLPVAAGTLTVVSSYQNQPLHITTVLASHRQLIRLKTAQIKLADAQLVLQGEVDVGAKTLALKGIVQQLSLLDIRELLALWPQTAAVALPSALDGTVHKLTLGAKGPWRNPRLVAEIDGSLQYQQLQAQLHANAHGDFAQFTVSSLRLKGENLQLTGNGAVDIAQQTLELQLQALARNLQLSQQLGLPMDARARVNLDASVSLSGALDAPDISAKLTSHGSYRGYGYGLRGTALGSWEKLQLKQWRFGLFSADRTVPGLVGAEALAKADAWLELNAVIAPQARRGTGKVSAHALPLSLLALTGVQLPSSLTGTVSIDSQFSGELANPKLDLSLSAAGSFEDAPWQISGDIGYAKGRVDLTGVQLRWAGHANFSLHGNLSAQALALEARGEAQLGVLNPWLTTEISDTGEVTFWASAEGTPQQPKLAGELKLTGRAPVVQSGTIQTAPLQLLLDWRTEGEALKLMLAAHHGSDSAASVDIRFVIAPFLQQLFARSNGDRGPLPIRFDASGNVDLAVLSVLIDPQIHRLRGRLQAELQADGNSAKPNVQGRIDLHQGVYEYRPGNLRLQQIEVGVRLAPDVWRIEQASAKTASSGSINLTGAVGFHQTAAPTLDFKLTAEQAYLLDMPGIKGAFSGDLHLTGSSASSLLEGQLSLRPLAVQIEYFMGGSVPEIAVVKVGSDRSQQGQPLSLWQNMALDVQINLDKESRVRGLGLDSGLRGQVVISGTLAEPQAGGEVNIAGGKFDLLGKKFDLTQGQIQFENNMVIIFVKGTYDYPDGKITAQLSGTTDNLAITFSADPAAGQEEIFARLLFGKSLSDISPLQAIRLVGLVRSLQSGTPEFDPVAKARELVGLDTLDVETKASDEGDQYALNLGKYITDRIYIQLQRSTDPLNPWQAQMQIELKDNLDLQLKSADDNESGAGSVELQWKKDY